MIWAAPCRIRLALSLNPLKMKLSLTDTAETAKSNTELVYRKIGEEAMSDGC